MNVWRPLQISSPRLITLDNSPAKIEQGVSIPFQTFENGDAQLEFVDAVLSLNVTPHITADKKQRKKLREIDDELQAVERKRRELQRKHEAERDRLSEKAEQARSNYERAMRDWKG